LDLVLTVEDNGPGFNLEEIRARTDLGRLSMRERARQISGYLRIQTDPRSGTLLTVRIPPKLPANRHSVGAADKGDKWRRAIVVR
jgi:signal transduction histidine kinase